MIRLAVCDDEALCLDSMRRMIEQWSANCGIPFQLGCFDNGDALLKSIRSVKTDVVLLDIMMPLLNGMDTAHEIREFDKMAKIVFLTSSPEFALQSYSVKASGYIIKPVSFEHLSEVLDDCTAALHEEPENLLLKSACGYHKIYLHDIEYIEAQNKRVMFFLKSGQSLTITEPLYSFENRLLTKDGFFKCHRSYIISMNHVNSFNTAEIRMKSGSALPIARSSAKAFQEAYFSYMFSDKEV
jgi:DNA-binding LytR/AlgR family response regulator